MDLLRIYFDLKAAPIVLSICGLKIPDVKRMSKLDFPAAASPNNTTYGSGVESVGFYFQSCWNTLRQHKYYIVFQEPFSRLLTTS